MADGVMQENTLDRVDGTVVAVRFRSEGFTVAVLHQAEQGDLMIVGDLSGIDEGQALSLYGHVSNHPKYGTQFRVHYFHPYMDETRDGITRFLSQEVQGVGATFAERIVAHFYPQYGGALLDRLQEAPELLRQIPGLGTSRIEAIAEALRESYGARWVLLKLYEHGVIPPVARAVVRFYEEKGLDVTRIFGETPYQMVQDVPELGFETIDRIARGQGIPGDDHGRIQAAIMHLLTMAFYRDGHLYLPARALVDPLVEMIWGGAIGEDDAGRQIADALEVLRNQGYVQVVTVQGELACYARQAWIVEERLTAHLSRLLDSVVPPLRLGSLGLEQVRRMAEARAGIILDDSQRLAFDHAMGSGFCIITGGPGTGKSTLARLVVASWEEAGLKVKLAAPTGRAARRLAETTGREAKTIHRLLEWREGDFQHNEEEPLKAGAILIDESSMLDAPLALSLFRAIPDGCRVLLMGDVDQLPSVGPGNVLRELINSGQVPVAYLNQIHRQDTSGENLIVSLAHAVNNAPAGRSIPGGPVVARRPGEGKVFLFDARLPWARCTCGAVRLPRHCQNCNEGNNLTPLPATTRGAELIQELVSDRIPRAFGVASEDIQVIAPQYRGELGVNELNERLRGVLNPVNTLSPEVKVGSRNFRVGDRVMAIRNIYEKDVVNGLQGTVIDADVGARSIMVRFEGEIIATFKGEALDDLALAYAITVHKSQGNEFPVVLLALDPAAGRLLYRQLLYTSITRARDLLVLVGDPIALDRATANDRPRRRWTGLGWWLERGLLQ
jgi:exodeoxyribonuclease V alpha subunit